MIHYVVYDEKGNISQLPSQESGEVQIIMTHPNFKMGVYIASEQIDWTEFSLNPERYTAVEQGNGVTIIRKTSMLKSNMESL